MLTRLRGLRSDLIDGDGSVIEFRSGVDAALGAFRARAASI
jgi:hypothetical protein